MTFAVDLAPFFTDFAETATFVTPVAVAGQTVGGIFDSAYQYVDQGSGYSGATPALTVRDSTLPAAVASALTAGSDVSLTLRGVTYTVVQSMPDGVGVTILRLRR